MSLAELFVDGQAIKNKTGRVHLFGANTHAWDRKKDLSSVENDAKSMKGLGFNCVRLVVDWNSAEVSTSPSEFTYNTDYIDYMIKAAEIFVKNGVYVIWDNHKWLGVPENYTNLKNFLPITIDPRTYRTVLATEFFTNASQWSGREHLKRLWQVYVSKLKGKRGIAMYDLVNEPIGPRDFQPARIYELMWQIYEYLITSIRAMEDDAILIVEPPKWSWQSMTRLLRDPLNRVVYSPHWYGGTNSSGIVTNNDIKYLRDVFVTENYVGNVLMKSNVPFLIGEFGNMYNNIEGDDKDVWIENSLKIFKEFPLAGWIWWEWRPDLPLRLKGTWIKRLVENVANLPTQIE